MLKRGEQRLGKHQETINPSKWGNRKTIFPPNWSDEEIAEGMMQAQRKIRHILHDVYGVPNVVEEDSWKGKHWGYVLGKLRGEKNPIPIEYTIVVNGKTLKVKLGGKYDENGYIQYEIKTFYPYLKGNGL